MGSMVKAHVTKPNNLSLIPSTHMVKERRDSIVVFRPPHSHMHTLEMILFLHCGLQWLRLWGLLGKNFYPLSHFSSHDWDIFIGAFPKKCILSVVAWRTPRVPLSASMKRKDCVQGQLGLKVKLKNQNQNNLFYWNTVYIARYVYVIIYHKWTVRWVSQTEFMNMVHEQKSSKKCGSLSGSSSVVWVVEIRK